MKGHVLPDWLPLLKLTVARHFIRVVPTIIRTIAPVLDGYTPFVDTVQVALLTLAAVCKAK